MVKLSKESRGVFKTMPNIPDGVYWENSERGRLLTNFSLDLRCMRGFWIRLWRVNKALTEFLDGTAEKQWHNTMSKSNERTMWNKLQNNPCKHIETFAVDSKMN